MQETDKKQHIKIHGVGLDKEGRCKHYHTSLDIAALLCAQCRKYYACYSCHDEMEDHPFAATAPEEEYPVLCGNCRRKLTRKEYKQGSCPYCHAGFNPRCSLHENIYFSCGEQKKLRRKNQEHTDFWKKVLYALFVYLKKERIQEETGQILYRRREKKNDKILRRSGPERTPNNKRQERRSR